MPRLQAVAAVSSAPIKPPQAAVACDVTARVVAPATSACNIGKSKSGPDVASATPHRTSTPLPTTARRSAGPGTSRPVIPLVVPRYLTTIGQVPDSPPCKKARTGGATPSPDEDAGDLESVPSDTREVRIRNEETSNQLRPRLVRSLLCLRACMAALWERVDFAGSPAKPRSSRVPF